MLFAPRLPVDLQRAGHPTVQCRRARSSDQVAFWESALRQASKTPKWQADLKKNYWSDDFTVGAEFAKELDANYAAMKSVLVDLGLAKQK